MFDDSNIIVGLEIGTSKICVVVGEQSADAASTGLNIVGLGQSPARGMRKGEIVDAALAEECVRNAVVEAEQMADVEIRSVYLGVTGGHIRGFNNRGVHPVVSADREISDDDVQDVIKNAKAINLPAENTVVHAVRQHFLVDGHDGITNPVGMLGARLEVDMHVVHGNTNRLQNSVRLVKGLQLEVEEIVFNGLASSLALLTSEQKELGALVIDIGGGTTDYVVYSDGVIRHTGALALGGDHVSNDLGHGLKVPLSRAEKLKLEHGSALVDEAMKGRTLTISNELGLPLKTINVEHLQRIMSLRLEEIFQLIGHDQRTRHQLVVLKPRHGQRRFIVTDVAAGDVLRHDVQPVTSGRERYGLLEDRLALHHLLQHFLRRFRGHHFFKRVHRLARHRCHPRENVDRRLRDAVLIREVQVAPVKLKRDCRQYGR